MALLDDAMVLASIEVCGDQFGATACSLESVLAAALKKSDNLANMRNIDFKLQTANASAQVFGDAGLLVKALEGLFETAVKFSKSGDPVRLSVDTAQEETYINIKASGQTIPQEVLSRFFDVLAIKEAIIPGGDLGLAPAAAERVIALLGGSVTVENLEPPGILLRVKLKSAGKSK